MGNLENEVPQQLALWVRMTRYYDLLFVENVEASASW